MKDRRRPVQRFAGTVLTALLSACASLAPTDSATTNRDEQVTGRTDDHANHGTASENIWPDFMPLLQPGLAQGPVRAEIPGLASQAFAEATVEPLAGASAKWRGQWSGWGGQEQQVDLRLAVTSISANKAKVTVARTVAGQPPLHYEGVGRLEHDELIATLPSGTVMRYRLRDRHTAEFIWRATNGGWMAGVLSRTNPTSRMAIESIPTDFVSDGKPVSLEAVVFRPDKAGPYPVLVFNHGSTGSGTNPKLIGQTWAEPNIARWFTERGWMLVFPQRRGRGNSGGQYEEGLEADGSGYSVRPEISLAGFERALSDTDAVVHWLREQADIDQTQMLIGGQSRGGALAVAYAGTRPGSFKGAINFVGGWMNDQTPATRTINRKTLTRGAENHQPTLWLYADHDPFYSLRHSRANFKAFKQAGGLGEFHQLPVKQAQSGHGIIADATLWDKAMTQFITSLVP